MTSQATRLRLTAGPPLGTQSGEARPPPLRTPLRHPGGTTHALLSGGYLDAVGEYERVGLVDADDVGPAETHLHLSAEDERVEAQVGDAEVEPALARHTLPVAGGRTAR